MFETWAIVSTIMITLLLLSCVPLAMAWIRRNHHPRERFALAALNSIVTLTLAFFSIVGAQVAPWDLISGFIAFGFGREPILSPPELVDYVLLLLVYALAIATIFFLHQRWDGLTSERQYKMQQRREEHSLLREGATELIRILRRAAPSPPHVPETHPLVSQLAGLTESIAWHDRARTLVQLKSPHYIFAEEGGWHTEFRTWVGIDENTRNLVLLSCHYTMPREGEVTALLDYGKKLAALEKRPDFAIILALEDHHAVPNSRFAISSVRIESEHTLLEGLVNWRDYTRELSRRVHHSKLPDSQFTVSDVFTPPNCIVGSGDSGRTEPLLAVLNSWLTDSGHRHIALLGDYGQGKSTAALVFAQSLLEDKDSTRVPILIELRGTSPRNLTPMQLLGAWASKYNINPQSLWHMHMAGRLLLIFEGFDEMALVGDVEMRIKHFRTLWEFCCPRAKILITGRPNFFFDDQEMTASLGLLEPTPGRPYCEAVRLLPFDIHQVADALRNHDEVVRDQICRFGRGNEQFRELIGRPSLLHIVSVLWQRQKLSEHLHELTSAYVMRLFIRHSYLRQGQKEEDSPEFMALTTEERQYFMKGIATYMVAKKLPNQIHGSQLNDVIESLIEAIPNSVSKRSPAISGEVRTPLRARLEKSEHGGEHVQTDVRTCGILVDDPVALGTFRFGHKSFMEYLFSEVIAERITSDESPDSPSILAACDARPGDIAHLPVSVRFLSESLGTHLELPQKSSDYQRALAKRILRLLLGGTTWTYLVGRVALYQSSFLRASVAWPLAARLLVTPFVWPVFVPAFAVLSVAVLLGVLLFSLTSSGGPLDNPIYEGLIVSLVAGLYLGSMIVSVRLLRGVTKLRVGGTWRDGEEMVSLGPFEIWNRLCKELGLDDRVLFDIAGIGWFSWTRRQRFNFFLDNE